MARAVLAELDGVREELADQQGLRSGRLVLGTTRTTGPFPLVQTLGRFHEHYPGVELAVREGLSVEMAVALRATEVDFALLTMLSAEDRRYLSSRAVAQERLVVMLPLDHRWAGRGPCP